MSMIEGLSLIDFDQLARETHASWHHLEPCARKKLVNLVGNDGEISFTIFDDFTVVLGNSFGGIWGAASDDIDDLRCAIIATASLL